MGRASRSGPHLRDAYVAVAGGAFARPPTAIPACCLVHGKRNEVRLQPGAILERRKEHPANLSPVVRRPSLAISLRRD
jgi:hypothetical protein